MTDLLSLLPEAQDNEMRIVVLEGKNTFLATLEREKAEDIMNAFEKTMGIPWEERQSQMTHAMMRIHIATALRKPTASKTFRNIYAAGVLWLAMRHWTNGQEIINGVDAMLKEKKTPVITASIANPVPDQTVADTAWAFMVGEGIHDGRDQLKNLESNKVIIKNNLN